MIKISRECALFFQRSLPVPRIGAVPEYVADLERYGRELATALAGEPQQQSSEQTSCPQREPAGEQQQDWQPTHKHLKTGGLYRVLHRGRLEWDLTEAVIYQAKEDGSVWVRPAAEFDDGRFVALTPQPQQGDDDWTKVTKENLLPHDLPPGSEVLRRHRLWERTGYGYMTDVGYIHDSDVTHFRRTSGEGE